MNPFTQDPLTITIDCPMELSLKNYLSFLSVHNTGDVGFSKMASSVGGSQVVEGSKMSTEPDVRLELSVVRECEEPPKCGEETQKQLVKQQQKHSNGSKILQIINKIQSEKVNGGEGGLGEVKGPILKVPQFPPPPPPPLPLPAISQERAMKVGVPKQPSKPKSKSSYGDHRILQHLLKETVENVVLPPELNIRVPPGLSIIARPPPQPNHPIITDRAVIDRLKKLGTVIELEKQDGPQSVPKKSVKSSVFVSPESNEEASPSNSLKMLEKIALNGPVDGGMSLGSEVTLFRACVQPPPPPNFLEPVIDIVEGEAVSVRPHPQPATSNSTPNEDSSNPDQPKKIRRVFPCDLCSLMFSQSSILRKHYLRSHINPNCITEQERLFYKIQADPNCPESNFIFRCHVCKKCFELKDQLHAHLKNHPPRDGMPSVKIIKNYKCDNCKAVFKWRKVFAKHKKMCRPPEPLNDRPQFHCLFCNQSFHSANKKKNHTLSYHPYVRKRHPCIFCPKDRDSYVSHAALVDHLLAEHPTVFFYCSICKERFITPAELSSHNLSKHNQETPLLESTINQDRDFYPCTVCQRIYLIKENYDDHFPDCKPPVPKPLTATKPFEKKIKMRKKMPIEKRVEKSPVQESNKAPEMVDSEGFLFSPLTLNVRDNLLNHLDGKLNSSLSPPLLDTTVAKSKTFQNFSGGFPSKTLPSEEAVGDPPRGKVPWEKYSFPKTYDGRCGLSSYIKDTSHLDIHTQLIMRQNLQRLNMIPLKENPPQDVPSVLDLERMGTETAESYGQASAVKQEGAVEGIVLGELSGEWVRDRTYICSVCGWETPCLWSMEDHKFEVHPNVLCPQHELVGEERHLSKEIFTRLAPVPPPFPVEEVASLPKLKDISCTKCERNKFASTTELHIHVLECAGEKIDWATSPRKSKRPRKRRRPRRGLKRNIPSTPQKPVCKFRTKPGDTDTIQKMIANLPAKRATRRVIGFDEVDLKTRSQATIQNSCITAAYHKAMKNARKKAQEEATRTEGMIPKIEKKESDYIDTSAEHGDVLSSLRMMRVKVPSKEIVPASKILEEAFKVPEPLPALYAQCQACSADFDTRSALKKHLKSCNLFKEARLNKAGQCKVCGNRFADLVVLMEHSCEAPMPKLEIEKDISPVNSGEIPVLSPAEERNDSFICGISFVDGVIKYETLSSVSLETEKLQKVGRVLRSSPKNTKAPIAGKAKKGMKRKIELESKGTKRFKGIEVKFGKRGLKKNKSLHENKNKKVDKSESKTLKRKGTLDNYFEVIKKDLINDALESSTDPKKKKVVKKRMTARAIIKTKIANKRMTRQQLAAQKQAAKKKSLAKKAQRLAQKAKASESLDSSTLEPLSDNEKVEPVIEVDDDTSQSSRTTRLSRSKMSSDAELLVLLPKKRKRRVKKIKTESPDSSDPLDGNDPVESEIEVEEESKNKRKSTLDIVIDLVAKGIGIDGYIEQKSAMIEEKCNRFEQLAVKNEELTGATSNEDTTVENPIDNKPLKKKSVGSPKRPSSRLSEPIEVKDDKTKTSNSLKKSMKSAESENPKNDNLEEQVENVFRSGRRSRVNSPKRTSARLSDIGAKSENVIENGDDKAKNTGLNNVKRSSRSGRNSPRVDSSDETQKTTRSSMSDNTKVDAPLDPENKDESSDKNQSKMCFVSGVVNESESEETKSKSPVPDLILPKEEAVVSLIEDDNVVEVKENGVIDVPISVNSEDPIVDVEMATSEANTNMKGSSLKTDSDKVDSPIPESALTSANGSSYMMSSVNSDFNLDSVIKEEPSDKISLTDSPCGSPKRSEQDFGTFNKLFDETKESEEYKRERKSSLDRKNEVEPKKDETHSSIKTSTASDIIKCLEISMVNHQLVVSKSSPAKIKSDEVSTGSTKDSDKNSLKDSLEKGEKLTEYDFDVEIDGAVDEPMIRLRNDLLPKKEVKEEPLSDAISISDESDAQLNGNDESPSAQVNEVDSSGLSPSLYEDLTKDPLSLASPRVLSSEEIKRKKLKRKLEKKMKLKQKASKLKKIKKKLPKGREHCSGEKEVLKIGLFKWEVSTVNKSPIKSECDKCSVPCGKDFEGEVSSSSGAGVLLDDIALPIPPPPPAPVKVNDLDSPVPSPSNTQSQPPSWPLNSSQPHKWNEAPVTDTSLGSILDSVNKLLNEPEGGYSPLNYPQYSLADLQKAMGASDAEMAVLQQLGEGSFQDDASVASGGTFSGSGGMMTEEWTETSSIMDLDNQSSLPPPPPPPPSAPQVFPSDTLPRYTFPLLTPKDEFSQLLQHQHKLMPRRRSPSNSSQNLLAAHQGKEVVCPSCSFHFMGFPALQLHVNKVHSAPQNGETSSSSGQQVSSTNKRVLLDSRRDTRLVCYVCSQILPSNLISNHMVTEHSLQPSDISKCTTVTGDPPGEEPGEKLKDKMSSALGDLLDRAVSNLLKAKLGSNQLSGSAVQLLTKLCAVRKKEASPFGNHRLSFLKLKLLPEAASALAGNSSTPPPLSPNALDDPARIQQLRPFSCSVCPQRFALAASRNKHESLVHRLNRQQEDTYDNPFDDDWREAPSPDASDPNADDNSRINPLCSDCGLSFETVEEMMNHVREDHIKRRRISVDATSMAAPAPFPVTIKKEVNSGDEEEEALPEKTPVKKRQRGKRLKKSPLSPKKKRGPKRTDCETSSGIDGEMPKKGGGRKKVRLTHIGEVSVREKAEQALRELNLPRKPRTTPINCGMTFKEEKYPIPDGALLSPNPDMYPNYPNEEHYF